MTGICIKNIRQNTQKGAVEFSLLKFHVPREEMIIMYDCVESLTESFISIWKKSVNTLKIVYTNEI